MAGVCTVDESTDDLAESLESEPTFAYASLPVQEGEQLIEPGEILPFRVPLGGLPWFWDEATAIYPYVYFDEGRWLVGEPTALVGQLTARGWRVPVEARERCFRDDDDLRLAAGHGGTKGTSALGGEASS